MGIREIARQLDRCPSNISRQVNNPENLDEYRVYGKWVWRFSAAKAIQNQKHKKSVRGRKAKIPKDEKLKKYLEESTGFANEIAHCR